MTSHVVREISLHTATAADVIPSVVALKHFLNKTAETDSGVKTTKSALLEAMNKRFKTTFSEQLYYLNDEILEEKEQDEQATGPSLLIIFYSNELFHISLCDQIIY